MAQAALAHLENFTDGIENRFAEESRQCSRPIDLVHLAKQSLGDRGLEAEILKLFSSQSHLYFDRLANSKTDDQRKMAAHTILGSARGIGAWHVAHEAEKVEWATTNSVDLGELKETLRACRTYIAEILND